MIDPRVMTTYAQYNEDLVLMALFSDVKKGFYIDVGANYPTIDSVTKIFYDKGWCGINIEPLQDLFIQLEKERPRDINLQIGIGDKSGEAEFREIVDLPGHSTFDNHQKKRHNKEHKYVDYNVPVRTLDDVLTEYKPKHIEFLKIDVEGFEYQVIAGNKWNKFRPEVVCIESNHVSQDWRPLLTTQRYRLFITDGLNEYYVAEENWRRTVGFAERMVVLDYHALRQHHSQSWAQDSKDLDRLHKLVGTMHQQLETQSAEVNRARNLTSLTLKERPWLSRLKRSFYGLTIDWYRHQKARKR